MTLREALTRATRQLDASPDLCADAARDAALLLRYALGISHAAQLADPEREFSPAQQAAYDSLILRRLANEPIQYITGEQEFYSLALRVTPAVLIPRPETEQLVEAVINEMKQSELDCTQPLRILNVGTGSGAIAIALAHYLPHARVTAVDLSAAALEVAASNAARHTLAGRIRFVASDLLAALPPDELPFDVIVSNPPYVPTSDRDQPPSPGARPRTRRRALRRDGRPRCLSPSHPPGARRAAAQRPARTGDRPQPARGRCISLVRSNQLRFLDDLQQIPRIALARRA